MKRALLMWALMVSAPRALADEAVAAAVEQGAELWVVKVHADWCDGCRLLGDVEARLRPRLGDAAVRFILFDLTNRQTKGVTEAQARALGLDDVLARNQGRIGTVLLVDPQTREVVEMWTVNDSFDRMAKRILSEVSEAAERARMDDM